MMAISAKDSLFQNILTHYAGKNDRFTALDCADFFAINRSVISHYLNRLCDDDKLIKAHSRPVRFYINTDPKVDTPAKIDKKNT